KEGALIAKKAESSDTSVFTATADGTAVAGSYNVKVDRLATTQVLYSQTFTATTAEIADLSSVSAQKLKLRVGGVEKEITVDSSNNSLEGIRDAINASGLQVEASIVDAGFVVDSSNNTIVFSDGTTRTATLTAGTYTGEALAAEIKRALEAANGGSDTYTVSWNATDRKFTITNDAGNANAIDILWEDAGTTAESLLGFTATDHPAIAVGGSASSDTAVGGYRLMLTAKQTGSAGRIAVLVDEDGDGTYEESPAETDTSGLSRLAFNPTYATDGSVASGVANLTQSQAAVDASLVVNGLTVTRSSNTIDDVITGVTITLADDSAGATELLTVSLDEETIVGRINGFVSAYNDAIGLVRSLTAVKEGESSLLSANGTARSIVDTLRATITRTFGSYTPARLGLSHSKEGVLSLDSDVLKGYLESDLEGVLDTFDRMAEALEDDLDHLITTAIPARTDGLESSIERIDDDMAELERRIRLKEVSLVKQFTLLEQTVGQLQQSGDLLMQQLDSLKGLGKKDK
ncbi:MAG TPA: hypothetical protein ENK20_03115, partial [Chromatiales bacterium]|nr:hypothetical protein [Chromatiales bacterium]